MIFFPPTYKLKLNANLYEIDGKNSRIPGWTDRILYKTKNNKL